MSQSTIFKNAFYKKGGLRNQQSGARCDEVKTGAGWRKKVSGMEMGLDKEKDDELKKTRV